MMIAVVMVLAMAVTTFAEEPTKGTITVKNATKGYVYNAYKVFDATYDGDAVSYTTPKDNASKLDASIFGWSTAADADGNISVWVKGEATETAVLDWVKENYAQFGGTAIPGVFDETNSTVTFSNLEFGYYYITSSLGSAVTIDSATPSAEVYDKNETKPTVPKKTIVSVDGTAQNEVTEANAHVGSVVGFKVTAETNNWIDKDTIRTEFVLEDTPTNMTIDATSVKVKMNGTEIAADAFTAAIADGKLTVTIPMTDKNGNSVYPANLGTTPGLIPVEVTYSATIDATAADGAAVNTIPGQNVKVYTYMFQLDKVDETGAALKGAQFGLYKGDTKVKFTKNSDGSYTYNESGDVTVIDLTETATAIIKGLDNLQDYKLKEIKVPKGYNQVEDVTVEKAKLVKADGTNTASQYDVKVENKKGTELPSTGGIGTTLFYVIGAALVLGSGVLMVSKKRMSAN